MTIRAVVLRPPACACEAAAFVQMASAIATSMRLRVVWYPEGDLNPYDVRERVRQVEHQADCVVVTASPVVVNVFNGNAGAVHCVWRDAAGGQLRRVTEVKKPEWLAQFLLGELYENGELDAG